MPWVTCWRGAGNTVMGFPLCLLPKIACSPRDVVDKVNILNTDEERMTNLGGREGPGQEQVSPCKWAMYSMIKSTWSRGNRAKPLPHSHCATDQRTHCFPNRWATFFRLGILPLTIASVFSQIQLEPFADVPAHTEASWSFLFSGDGTPQPLA